MDNIVKLSTVSVLLFSAFLFADETVKIEQKELSGLGHMFENSKVTGEIRSMYAGYNQKKAGEYDTYATAIGGNLKYELAELNGFNAAVAFSVSHDIGFATGDEGIRQNNELSSSDGEYTAFSEAYLNYKFENFNLRAGRQIIDTPLADSDDIRMIPNTFEAYIATYEISNFNFMVGNLQNWQGYDAGLDDGWVKAGENGTWFGGMQYAADMFEANAWYYNITKLTNASYFDVALNYEVDKDMSILGAVQYLNENEISNSSIEASIYGVLAELKVYDFGFSLAYNNSSRKAGKETFSGFGGGTLFTSMDTLILNDIAVDRDVSVIVSGISYEFNDMSLFYAYGDSDGGANGLGVKAHNVEQDIGFEYTVIRDKLVAHAVYSVHEDKENLPKTEYDWEHLKIKIAYNF